MQSRDIKFGLCEVEQKDTLLSEIESEAYAAYRAVTSLADRANALTIIERAMQARAAIFERVCYARQEREKAERRAGHSERLEAMRASRVDPNRPSQAEIFEESFGGMKPR